MKIADGQASFLAKIEEAMRYALRVSYPTNSENCGKELDFRENVKKYLLQQEIPWPISEEQPTKKTIKSDGGSSSYYDYKHPDHEELQTTEDFIEFALYNDFDLGNINKTTKRVAELAFGQPKEGNSIEYELNKIDYSVAKLRKRYCK